MSDYQQINVYLAITGRGISLSLNSAVAWLLTIEEQLLNPRSVSLIYQAEPTLDNNSHNQMFTIVIKLIKTICKLTPNEK